MLCSTAKLLVPSFNICIRRVRMPSQYRTGRVSVLTNGFQKPRSAHQRLLSKRSNCTRADDTLGPRHWYALKPLPARSGIGVCTSEGRCRPWHAAVRVFMPSQIGAEWFSKRFVFFLNVLFTRPSNRLGVCTNGSRTRRRAKAERVRASET